MLANLDGIDITFLGAFVIILVGSFFDKKHRFSYMHGRIVFQKEEPLISRLQSASHEAKFQSTKSFLFRRAGNVIQFATDISYFCWASAEVTRGKQNTSSHLRALIIATTDNLHLTIRVSIFADLYLLLFFGYLLTRSLRADGPPYWSYILVVPVVMVLVSLQTEMGIKQMLFVYDQVKIECGLKTTSGS